MSSLINSIYPPTLASPTDSISILIPSEPTAVTEIKKEMGINNWFDDGNKLTSKTLEKDTDIDKDIEDIETENTTIKEELAYFMGKQSADDSYDFRDYYETSFGFAFAVLDRADEIIRNVEFRSYKY